MSKDNGGPAFPESWAQDYGFGVYQGMSLRDYYAGQALQGICNSMPENTLIEDDVKLAFQYADAMLKAREG